MINEKDMEYMNGEMGENMMEIGETINSMEMEYIQIKKTNLLGEFGIKEFESNKKQKMKTEF